jgi:Transcriptional regulators
MQKGRKFMNKEIQVIGEFRDLLNKLIWLNKIKMEAQLKEYKSSEVHCIEFIGMHTDVNVTKLAETFYMTLGAISKLTKKLISKGIIESYKKPENKKEIYFKLTEKGKTVYTIHEKLHNEFKERDKEVFEDVKDEELDIMINFAKKYGNHLDKELKKLGFDTKIRNYE